jgi:hypothetical protein
MRVSLRLISMPLAVATAVAACSSFKDDPICTSDSCADAGLDGASLVDAGPRDATLHDGAADATLHDGAADATLHDGAGDATLDGGAADATADDGAIDAPDDVGNLDSAPDSQGIGDAGFTPTTLAASANVPTQTGHAQQRHIVFASASARFFVFYLDDASQTSLKVRSSADFETWRDEAPLALLDGHGNEGRNFSVATRAIGGIDVFHVILALHPVTVDKDVHRTYHARARVVSGGAFAWAGTSLLTDINVQLDRWGPAIKQCDPDGPDVTITKNGVVSDITGWQAWPDSQCDANVFVSPNVDTGGSVWIPDFPFHPTFYMQNEHTSNVHSLTSLPSGDIVAMFGNGGTEEAPTNVAWSRSRAGGIDDAGADADAEATTWPRGRDVFGDAGTQSRNDWSQCVLEDGILHAVRRIPGDTDAIEHRRHDGTQWSAGGVIPAASGGRGRGIVLVSRGTTMKMLKLADDGRVQSLAWDGSAWETDWQTAVPADQTRQWLSGSGCGGEPVVIWTEGPPGSERIVGERVRF